MLDTLRQGAASWVAKIFIALLVLSFGVWGIADIFRGFNAQVLATVGEREISIPEYERAYQDAIARLSARIGQRLSTQQARAIGVPQQVLRQLVSGAALDAQAGLLGLGLSDKAVARTIIEAPAFHGPDGKFSQAVFQQVLRTNGLNEQSFVAIQRRDMIRQQLIGTVGDAARGPNTLVDALNRFTNETRIISYFALPESAAGTIAAPGDATLKSYYEAHIGRYTAPEYRQLGMLLVTPKTLMNTITVSDADLKAEYEARKDQFSQPEQRQIEQIIFADMAAAQAGYKKLKRGADFLAVAKSQGMAPGDVKLGWQSEKAMPDAKIAKAAFALHQGKISKPVKGVFSTVIIKVTGIKPGHVQSFDAAKAELETTLKRRKAGEKLLDLYDKIEDLRGGGSTLAEVGQKLGLPFVTFTTDAQGKGQDGKAAALAGIGADKLLGAAFESDVGVENDPADVTESGRDKGYAWFDVSKIISSTKKPLDSVRAEVEKDWRAFELAQRLRNKAADLAAKGRGRESFADLAKSVGARVETTKPIKRASRGLALPGAAIAQAFTLAEGGYGSAKAGPQITAAAGAAPRYFVFRLDKIIAPPPPSAADAKKFMDQLRTGLEDDLTESYIAALEKQFGVSINQEALKRANLQ